MSYFSARFDHNGCDIEVEFLWLNRSGRLNVWVNRIAIAEVEWCDWSPRYATEEGLRAATLAEINTILTAADAGEIDEPPPAVAALLRKVTGALKPMR